jgi:hypothetical protein
MLQNALGDQPALGVLPGQALCREKTEEWEGYSISSCMSSLLSLFYFHLPLNEQV